MSPQPKKPPFKNLRSHSSGNRSHTNTAIHLAHPFQYPSFWIFARHVHTPWVLVVSPSNLLDMSDTHSSGLPPFSLTAPQFDLSTFIGRFTFFCDITNPLTLFTSDKDISESKKLLDLVCMNVIVAYLVQKDLNCAILSSLSHPHTFVCQYFAYRCASVMRRRLICQT